MHLIWHNYRYYPYERELAAREVAGLLRAPILRESPDGFELIGESDSRSAARLTYFSGIGNGPETFETLQSRLESAARFGKTRQATRYSVHGLHEYKGKFNPQVVKAILNIFNIEPGQRVLDPFCGSGTTLVECAHLGISGYGVDLNPLAVFIANAKLQALVTPADDLWAVLRRLSISLNRTRRWNITLGDDPRSLYLQSWFDSGILEMIEIIHYKIKDIGGSAAPIFLAVASNLLRAYSLQDPKDLRIRRRKSPLPERPFPEALLDACTRFIERTEATQAILGTDLPSNRAALCDATTLEPADLPALFDASITSPPYAMALPYIDTQRLSLVWLNLLDPENILELEAELIGSRELRGHARKRLSSDLEENKQRLPEAEAFFCHEMQNALDAHDGFRRKAVPILLYRYFASMQKSFRAIRDLVHRHAPFALIVGHNHSVLGGVRYDIDTPVHLANIASGAGWTVEELIPLQTYHRYGYHMNNAINAETLVILRKS